jgi:hypothetical protein
VILGEGKALVNRECGDAGEKTEQAGRKALPSWEKGRMSVGERPYLSGSRRAAKTFTAAAKNVFSGRREYS